MRKLALASLVLLALLALAACGGGGSSSSAGTTASTTSASTSAPTTPESAWAKEVTQVFSEFENQVSARLTEEISESSSQPLLEPLYATYSINLSVLGNKLESTEPPPACVALRKRMVGYVRQVAALTHELGKQSHRPPEKYAQMVGEQGLKIDVIGQKLGKIATDPSC